MNNLETISINDLDLDKYLLFDVRSPKEYEEYHLPGAINLSIFTNEQRAEIGTLYKQESKEAAIERGLEVVGPKLPALFQKIKTEKKKNPDKKAVIYCARGGLRSKSIAQTMNMIGIQCLQLEGGIRSYRKQIESFFERFIKTPRKIIVLEGHTGTMKTKILEQLQSEGYPVINLEEMAGHKGSIFGRIGEQPSSQKKFESNLFERLKELETSQSLIIESESKRIGRVVVPDFLLEGKYSGTRIHVEIPFHLRVHFICNVYKPLLHKDEIVEAVNKLSKRIPLPVMEDLQHRLQNQNYEKVVSLLLENYYDPKYEFAEQKYESECVKLYGDSFEEIYIKVKEQIKRLIL
ncbi:tRNA 2-selenouridine(34) synthase MnmH [Fictibacillus sp. UD]|uniref:tRNA 2-selenouridine(34) synthase MnmH n=1 Tax=Fictibacillus sp. UD TaxID=3038777 RepID=UPI00374579B7